MDPAGDPVASAVVTAPPVAAGETRAAGRPGVRTAPAPLGAVVAAVAVAGGVGVALRAWLLTHVPLFGDEAVVGLMGRQIAHGHLNAFYWGQRYGGLESLLATAALAVGGGGPTALNLTAVVLSAAAAAGVAAVVRVAGGRPLAAVLAGAAAWVWPYAVVWNSTRELGFRYAALCCGVAALWTALAVRRPGATAAHWVGLGLALGLGWWASPEIAYVAVPCLVALGAWWVAAGRRPGPGRPVALWAVAGFAVGSLPWWYANLGSGFASLSRGAYPVGPGQGYGGRLATFFTEAAPVALGVRSVPFGAWVGGDVVGPVLYVLVAAAVLAAAVVALGRGGDRVPAVALAAGVAAFPFLYAAVPSSGYWSDGRYGVFLPFLVAPLAALALRGGPATRRAAHRGSPRGAQWAGGDRRRLAAGAAALLAATALTVAAAHAGGVPDTPGAFASGWGDPNIAQRQVVAALEAHHLTDAWGDYWTAYDLDFLAGGRLAVSPSVLDVDRWPALAAQVAASRQPAWLFFSPRRAGAAAAAFANPQPGPGPYTEATFLARLKARGIGYRVVHLGVLDAVVPDRRVVRP